MRIALVIGIALSFLTTMLGALFKMQSWEGGGIFLTLGMVILPAITIALAIYALWKKDNPDAVLKLDPDKVPDTVEEAKEILRNEDDMIV